MGRTKDSTLRKKLTISELCQRWTWFQNKDGFVLWLKHFLQRTAFADRSLSRTRWQLCWYSAALRYKSSQVLFYEHQLPMYTGPSHTPPQEPLICPREASQGNICSWILFPQKLESRNITKLFTQYEHRELRGNSNTALYYKPSEKLARRTPKLVPLMSDEIFNS